MHEQRLIRRRRSVARAPAMVAPIDIPDDAPGRVAFIAVRAPADVLAPKPVEAPQTAGAEAAADPALSEQLQHGPAWVAQWGGWVAVGLLIVVLIFVFVAGMAITR